MSYYLIFQAGCVHFTMPASAPACDIKVLILLYTNDRKAYLGFIPNDQTAFVDRLRKVIQYQKSTQALIRQTQVSTLFDCRNKIIFVGFRMISVVR